jgi:hypothetical protein
VVELPVPSSSLPYRPRSPAVAINDAGDVVGDVVGSINRVAPALWRAGEHAITLLPVPPGYEDMRVFDINARGCIATLQ